MGNIKSLTAWAVGLLSLGFATASVQAQNFGIGLTDPASKLHVRADAGTTVATLIETSSQQRLFEVDANGAVFLSTQAGAVPLSTSTDYLVIGADGRIGRTSNAILAGNGAGNPGQVLTSQGPGQPPIWTNLTDKVELITKKSGGAAPTTQAYPTGTTINYIALPNLNHTINVGTTGPAKVMVQANGSASKATNNGSRVYAQYEIFVDGVGTGVYQRVSIDGNEDGQFAEVPWSISTVVTLNPGPHTVEIRGAHAGGDTGLFANDVVWLCTPQNFVGQAALNLVIVKD